MVCLRRRAPRHRRRPRTLLCLAVAVAVGLGGACGGDAPKRAASTTTTTSTAGDAPFISADGRFEVVLPGAPKREVQPTPAAGVTLELVTFTVEDGDEHLYQVAYVDYPASLGPLDPDGTLDGAVNGAVNRTQGTLVDKRRLDYLGLPAVHFSFTVGEATVEARTVLAGRRLYTLQAVTRTPPAPAFETLVATFRLKT